MSKIWCHLAIRGAARNLTYPPAGQNLAKNRYTGEQPRPKPLNPALFGRRVDVFHQPQAAEGGGEALRGRTSYEGLALAHTRVVLGVTLKPLNRVCYTSVRERPSRVLTKDHG